MQAQIHIEPMEDGKSAIVVTELPYQVNKATLIEQDRASLPATKKIDGITGCRTTPTATASGFRSSFAATRIPRRSSTYLLKHTDLRKTFGVIMLALVDGAAAGSEPARR